MRRALIAGLALLALAAPAQARVLVVGDSLAVGTGPHLKTALPGEEVVVDGRIGRPSSEAVSVLRSKYASGDEVVVFDAGTNDDPGRPAVLARDLLAAKSIAGDSCMVIATLVRPPLNGVSVAGLNRAVENFASSASGVEVVDWAGAVADDPGLMSRDGVHPDAEGYAERGRLVADAVEACGVGSGGGSGTGSTDTDDDGTATTDDDTAATDDDDDTAPAPRPRAPAKRRPVRDLSGVLVTEPVEFGDGVKGELVLPAAEGRGPGVVFLHDGSARSREAARAPAEQLAAAGITSLIYDDNGGDYAQQAADGRAGVAMLGKRPEVRPGKVALWGPGDGADVASLVAGGNRGVAAVVAVDPSGLTPASREDWRTRGALDESGGAGGSHAATTLYRFQSDLGRPADLAFEPVPAWRKVAQPVFAGWAPVSEEIPVAASARTFRDGLATGANRDRTLSPIVAGEAFDARAARWLDTRLGSDPPPPAVREVLPVQTSGPAPVDASDPGLLDRAPVQIAWLLLPLIAMAAAIALGGRGKLTLAVAGLDLAAVGALVTGVRSIDSKGGDVAAVLGLPVWLLLAALLALAGAVATGLLVRDLLRNREQNGGLGRAELLACGASTVWLALIANWLI